MKLCRSLQVVEGPDQGKTWLLTRQQTVLGREDPSHQKVSDHEVSGQHCRIVVKGRKVLVSDLGSTNGTWVNGKRRQSATLGTGDVLRIGRTSMRLVTQEVPEEGEVGDLTQIKEKVQKAKGLLVKARGLGFNHRLLAVMLLTALLSWLIAVGPIISGQGKTLEDEEKRRGAVLALALAAANREALRLNEEMLVDVKGVAKEEGVVEAMVLDRHGRILAPVAQLHQMPGDDNSQRAAAADDLLMQELGPGEYDIAMPIRAFDPRSGAFAKVGTARVIFSLAHVKGLVADAWINALISLLVVLVLACLACVLVLRLVNRPLLRLRDDAEAALKDRQPQLSAPKGFSGAAELAEQMARLLGKLAQGAPLAPSPAPSQAPARDASRQDDGRLKLLADLVGQGLLVLDGTYHIRLANQGAALVMGEQPEALPGRHLLAATSDQQLKNGLLELINQAGTKPGQVLRGLAQCGDGRQINLSVHLELAPSGEPGLVMVALGGTTPGVN